MMTIDAPPQPSSVERIKQPNSRLCFACGLENTYGLGLSFYEVGSGEIEVEYTVPEHFQGYPGVVHGGIVAAMLDEVLGRVVMIGDHSHFMVTARLEIRYRKSVPIGKPLRVHGWLTRRRGPLATAKAEIRLPDGSVAAEAKATLFDYPDQEGSMEQLEELGWKVYPDKP
ncbi:unnamed protein product [marine sediment metagenome]|uniref:Acyl-coenzyme A thioesterase THEM4 n=1 Tax=marine sediment metagenome TaxID=412755 RepID=X0YFQ5_9ZZZZ